LVLEKIYDVLEYQKLSRNPKTKWKQIGIELKFAEIIENMEQKDFDTPGNVELLEKLTEKLEPIVESLLIKKLQPRISITTNSLHPKARVVNFTSEECYHGSLEFVGKLSNLKNLKIIFHPGKLERNYEKRFFKFAIADIENLGKALNQLKMLENFSIVRSDLSESLKVFHLLTPMTNLKFLDLSFCSITSKESGEHFEAFLSQNSSLKHLELKGNELNSDFCEQFAKGIEKFKGNFNYLGMSMTPTLGNGLESILKSITNSNNVIQLNISSCENENHEKSENCFQELVNLIECEGLIRVINMQNNQIVNENIKESFIKALEKNFEIDEILCDNCGEKN
jgi:hypothetical protein